MYHNTLHFCEFCSTSGTLQRLPSGSVYRRQQYPRYGYTFVGLPSTIVITPGRLTSPPRTNLEVYLHEQLASVVPGISYRTFRYYRIDIGTEHRTEECSIFDKFPIIDISIRFDTISISTPRSPRYALRHPRFMLRCFADHAPPHREYSVDMCAERMCVPCEQCPDHGVH